MVVKFCSKLVRNCSDWESSADFRSSSPYRPLLQACFNEFETSPNSSLLPMTSLKAYRIVTLLLLRTKRWPFLNFMVTSKLLKSTLHHSLSTVYFLHYPCNKVRNLLGEPVPHLQNFASWAFWSDLWNPDLKKYRCCSTDIAQLWSHHCRQFSAWPIIAAAAAAAARLNCCCSVTYFKYYNY